MPASRPRRNLDAVLRRYGAAHGFCRSDPFFVDRRDVRQGLRCRSPRRVPSPANPKALAGCDFRLHVFGWTLCFLQGHPASSAAPHPPSRAPSAGERAEGTSCKLRESPLPASGERVWVRAMRPHPIYLAGLYQLSRPFCSFSPATSGVSVPLMTLADSTQVSFSRFGVPRDRIW